MSNTRQIVDFSIGDQGKEARDALYAEIHDRVMAKFEEMKLGISQNLITPHQESYVVEDGKEGHEDEEEDEKLVKKMVKGKCLKKESIEDEDEEEFEDEFEEEDEDFEEEDEDFEEE